MATLQPVTKTAGEFWTPDFEVAAQWFREADLGKRMRDQNTQRASAKRKKKAPRKRAAK